MPSFFPFYYLTIEAGCLLASIVFLRRESISAWGLQRWYLSLMVLTELAGTWWISTQGSKNQWIYNLYLPCIPVFLGLLLYRIINTLVPTHRNWLYGSWLCCGTAFVVETWLKDGIAVYHYQTRLLVNSLISLACLYYFVMQFRVPGYRNLKRDPGFCWVLGAACFYFGHIILVQASAIIAEADETIFGLTLHTALYSIILTSLYGLWTFAFYLQRPAPH